MLHIHILDDDERNIDLMKKKKELSSFDAISAQMQLVRTVTTFIVQ